jgi:hypothetical protein
VSSWIGSWEQSDVLTAAAGIDPSVNMVKPKQNFFLANSFLFSFISENCFANNCANALSIVFYFIKLFLKIIYQILF